MELEDLLKLIGASTSRPDALQAELDTVAGQSLPADIRWLMVQSYFTQPPDTAAARNVGQQVQQAGQNFPYVNAPGPRPSATPAACRPATPCSLSCATANWTRP